MGLISWLTQFVFTFELNGSNASVEYLKLDDQRLLITTKYPDGETIETIAYVMPGENEEITKTEASTTEALA